MRFPAFTWGVKIGAAIEVVYPGFLNGGAYAKKIHDHISRAASDFYMALTNKERKPLFRELMFFNLMKSKVTLHQTFLPADYDYWKMKGWLEKDFYDEQSLPKIKNALAKFLVKRKVKKMLQDTGINVGPEALQQVYGAK
jgi:site-specific recombinase XerD